MRNDLTPSPISPWERGESRIVQEAHEMAVDSAAMLAWLEKVAGRLHEQRAYLTDLDAAIGDADHGVLQYWSDIPRDRALRFRPIPPGVGVDHRQ